jgi:hypothetical protein
VSHGLCIVMVPHQLYMPSHCGVVCDLASVSVSLSPWSPPPNQVRTIVGDELIKENYPQIHAVGRAAPAGNEPRLIDLQWGTQGCVFVCVRVCVRRRRRTVTVCETASSY